MTSHFFGTLPLFSISWVLYGSVMSIKVRFSVRVFNKYEYAFIGWMSIILRTSFDSGDLSALSTARTSVSVVGKGFLAGLMGGAVAVHSEYGGGSSAVIHLMKIVF